MLRQATYEEVTAYLDSAYELALDPKRSVYPTYTDGIKSKDDFTRQLFRSFERPNDTLLVFEQANTIKGLIQFFVLPADAYLQVTLFNIETGADLAFQAFDQFIITNYPDYKAYIGLPSQNMDYQASLQTLGFGLVETSHVGVLHLATVSSQLRTMPEGIVAIKPDNFALFQALHDKSITSDTYWTSDRLLAHLDDWRIFTYCENDLVQGAVYFTYYQDMVEIFGFDYADQTFDSQVFKALLQTVLYQGWIDERKYLCYFHDDQEQPIVEELGMTIIGDYLLYCKNY